MENQLLKLKLFRDKKHNLGKRIGNQLWFHIDYVLQILSEDDFLNFKNALPSDFKFNILRYDNNKNELVFIDSPNFDNSNEPIVGDSYRVSCINNTYSLNTIQKKSSKNHLIYHHKWMFVKDDYNGFCVSSSKQRSLDWKGIMGVNKGLSSKIGRVDFWDAWIKDNSLEKR
jgi:hypothetical protein